jgi:hypothetical protein
MAEVLLTPKDIAARLNLKVRTVYEWLQPGGSLYELRLDLGPKIIRIDPVKFERWLANASVN